MAERERWKAREKESERERERERARKSERRRGVARTLNEKRAPPFLFHSFSLSFSLSLSLSRTLDEKRADAVVREVERHKAIVCVCVCRRA